MEGFIAIDITVRLIPLRGRCPPSLRGGRSVALRGVDRVYEGDIGPTMTSYNQIIIVEFTRQWVEAIYRLCLVLMLRSRNSVPGEKQIRCTYTCTFLWLRHIYLNYGTLTLGINRHLCCFIDH